MIQTRWVRKFKHRSALRRALGRIPICLISIGLIPTPSHSAEDVSIPVLPSGSAIIPSAADLFKKFQPAVVKIIIKHESIPVTVGAGFFTSKTGHLVTNHHVMRHVISQPEFSAEFVLSNGDTIRDFKVANCGDDRNIDLCLLKLDVSPKSFFTLDSYKASPGESIFVIGHPRGFDFSISNGIVSGVRRSPKNIEEVQISAAISPGNSGGPIFNSKGRLIGIVTKFLADSQNLNFGILASEIHAYQKMNRDALPVRKARQAIFHRTRSRMREMAKSELTPALSRALRSKSLTGLKGVKEVTFDFGDQTLKTYIPSMMETCTKSSKQSDVHIHACFAASDTAVFSLQRFTLENNNGLLEMNNKVLLDPKPLGIVNSLKQDGTWSTFEARLGPERIKSFYSSPSKARCQRLLPNAYPDASFSESPACHFTVHNDEEPGARSVNVWLEDGRYLYSFAIWLSDSALEEYFRQVPTLAILTSRTIIKGPKEIIATSLKRK